MTTQEGNVEMETVETVKIVLKEYHLHEKNELIAARKKDGWEFKGSCFHSANASELTFERHIPLYHEYTGHVATPMELLREAQRCLSFSSPMSILYQNGTHTDFETHKQLSLEINRADLAIRDFLNANNIALDPRNNSIQRTPSNPA